MKDLQTTLIERCMQGDRKAQTALYTQYADAMYNTACRLMKREDHAADVLQEAFVKAFNQLDRFRGESTFGAWLKRIVVNTAINELKKKREFFESLNEVAEPVTETTPQQWEGIGVEQVKEALLELAPGYRAVLSLYLLEGYDHKEISEVLGISVSTSLTQYSRGRKQLKERLEKIMCHGSA